MTGMSLPSARLTWVLRLMAFHQLAHKPLLHPVAPAAVASPAAVREVVAVAEEAAAGECPASKASNQTAPARTMGCLSLPHSFPKSVRSTGFAYALACGASNPLF